MNRQIPFIKTSIWLLFAITTLAFINCSDSVNEDTIITNQMDITHLPYGASLVLRRDQGDSSPLLEHLWLCGLPSNGAGNSDGTWDYTRNPIVKGNVVWSSEFNIMLDGNGSRIITGNALPDHPTGVFPIDPTSVTYQYDRNTNTIEAHQISYTFPEIPEVASSPDCFKLGPSGVSLTGSVIYHEVSKRGNYAVAHEILDNYGGHIDGTQRYHYRYMTDKLKEHIVPY